VTEQSSTAEDCEADTPLTLEWVANVSTKTILAARQSGYLPLVLRGP
jgi:hypothetical protein